MARKSVNLYWLRPGELTAYRGHSILVLDSHGHVGARMEGFYHRRTRFLSRLVLKVNGAEPTFVSANPVEPHSITSYHLAPSPAGAAAGPDPEDEEKGGGEIARKGIEIHVNRFVGGGLHQDVHVTNHGMAETRVTLAWELAADFADQSEAQQGQRQQQAPVQALWRGGPEGGGEIEFRYLHPDLAHVSLVRFSGPGDFAEGLGVVSCTISLRPRQTETLSIEVVPVFRGEAIEPFYGLDGVAVRDTTPDRLRDDWTGECARLVAANAPVQTAWDRAAADIGSLHLLEGDGPEQFTPAAGIPNYIGLFGRDTLMAAWQSALLNRATLRGTLRLLGKWNAKEYNDKFDAQPGKVLHQRQLSPLALLGKTPFLHYYGDYSAPGLFLLGLASDLAYTGDGGFFLSMRDKALATIEWMDRDGDLDRDGFYRVPDQGGLRRDQEPGLEGFRRGHSIRGRANGGGPDRRLRDPRPLLRGEAGHGPRVHGSRRT